MSGKVDIICMERVRGGPNKTKIYLTYLGFRFLTRAVQSLENIISLELIKIVTENMCQIQD